MERREQQLSISPATALEEFAESEEFNAGVNVDVLAYVLTLRADYGGCPDEASWDAGDITTLLEEVLPRKALADEQLLRDTVPSLAAYLRFLGSTDRLGAAAHSGLQAELSVAGARFVDGMNDKTRWGPAKAALTAMRTEGVDTEDPAAVEAWMNDFNSRGESERRALMPAPLSGDVLRIPKSPKSSAPVLLPPFVLSSEEELLAAARESAVVRTLAALLTMAEDGLPVDSTGALRPKDAQRLCEHIDAVGPNVPDDDEHDGFADESSSYDSAAHLLARVCWALARKLAVIEVTGGIVRRGSAASSVEEPSLEFVFDLTEAMLDFDVLLPDFERSGDKAEAVTDIVMRALSSGLTLTHITPDPLPVSALATPLLLPLAEGADEPGAVDFAVFLVMLLMLTLHRMSDLGLVVLHETTVDGEDTEENGFSGTDLSRHAVTLTPLGSWWLHRVLSQNPTVVAPSTAYLAAMTVDEVMDFLFFTEGIASGDDDLDDESGSEFALTAYREVWLRSRPGDVAVKEIVENMRAQQAYRQVAVRLLRQSGADAVAAVDELVEDPGLRPYGLGVAVLNGVPVAERLSPHPPEKLVELGAAMLETVGPEAVPLALGALSPEQRQMAVENAWRVASPRTREVLDNLGRHAERKLAKSARKAAFKLNSIRG